MYPTLSYEINTRKIFFRINVCCLIGNLIAGVLLFVLGYIYLQQPYQTVQDRIVSQKEQILGYSNVTVQCLNIPCLETTYILGIEWNSTDYVYNVTSPLYCALEDQGCEILHYQMVESWLIDLWFDLTDPSNLHKSNDFGANLQKGYLLCYCFGGSCILTIIMLGYYSYRMYYNNTI